MSDSCQKKIYDLFNRGISEINYDLFSNCLCFIKDYASCDFFPFSKTKNLGKYIYFPCT